MGVPATAALWDGGGPATEDQHDGVAIEVEGLTKRYGDATVVDDLTFSVRPGRVTGFLGPNGAGKSTTMQMLLGLATPTEGRATIGDRTYADLDDPVRTVGAEPERLERLLTERGAGVSVQPDGALAVTGMEARAVGIIAGTAAITLYELATHSASLEEAFMELTRDALEYTTRGAAA